MTVSALRWHTKKAARKATALASLTSSSLAVRNALGGPRVRAITYHRFGRAERDPWSVEAGAFDSQMRWLAERGLAISLGEALAFAGGGQELGGHRVLVTIDDGFRSVLEVAAPILREYRIPAVAFVTSNMIGNREAGRGAGAPYLSWDDVLRLRDGGIEIGSHSHTHRSMARLTPEQVLDEGLRSKQLLESRLGAPVSSFAYPFGMRRDESQGTAQILARCGYRSLFISQHGSIRPGSDLLRLPRVKVEGGDPHWLFHLACRGGMDAWRLVDDVL